jgi:hypothetical protein
MALPVNPPQHLNVINEDYGALPIPGGRPPEATTTEDYGSLPNIPARNPDSGNTDYGSLPSTSSSKERRDFSYL